jgi:hypothetical protein
MQTSKDAFRNAADVTVPVSGQLLTPSAGHGSSANSELVFGSTESMLEAGHLVSPLEFQRLMGWSSGQAVWKALASHRVFCITHKSERFFPTFFSDPSFELKHLEAVTRALGHLPGGVKLQFFLTPKGSLSGESPLQALADGRLTKVLDVARAFAEDHNK